MVLGPHVDCEHVAKGPGAPTVFGIVDACIPDDTNAVQEAPVRGELDWRMGIVPCENPRAAGPGPAETAENGSEIGTVYFAVGP